MSIQQYWRCLSTFPDVIETTERPSITMANPPDTAQNAKLAQDLLEQALHAGSGKTMSHIKHNLSLQVCSALTLTRAASQC